MLLMFYIEEKITADKSKKTTPGFARCVAFEIMTKTVESFLILQLQNWI